MKLGRTVFFVFLIAFAANQICLAQSSEVVAYYPLNGNAEAISSCPLG
jgi:hypothetical protein